MLIQGLCDYYDILARTGKLLPNGYSNVKIHYCCALAPDGKIVDILDFRDKYTVKAKKGKDKEIYYPRLLTFPERTEKSAIEANIIDHRPLYLFGLNHESGKLIAEDKTNKAMKSHLACVEKNLDFIKDIHSPLVDAFRNFLSAWVPGAETLNKFLLSLGKDYASSGFAFCLSGSPDLLLHDDPMIRQKWESRCLENNPSPQQVNSQCAISGCYEPIARTHHKIKGIKGGSSMGMSLVQNNEPSGTSYGNEQSYNSNISVSSMQKYTAALNYLTANPKHNFAIGDTTIVIWAANPAETSEAIIKQMLCGATSGNSVEMEKAISGILAAAKCGMLTKERLQAIDVGLDPGIGLYIFGMKPNVSRIAINFLQKGTVGNMLHNIADFQNDLQTGDKPHVISLQRICAELIPPNSKDATVEAALSAKLITAISSGMLFPVQLLGTIVRRVKKDCQTRKPDDKDKWKEKPNALDAGLLKAYFKRNYKEVYGMGLNKENQNQAYLCGRLFAVLEKIQKDAATTDLNRTIKDSFFSAAASKPVLVMPKLLTLAQHHMNKLKSKDNASKGFQIYYDKLIGEILDKLDGGFPNMLLLPDQGRFMIGYYQQYQDFFKKHVAEGEIKNA